jgi:hypothetical protein
MPGKNTRGKSRSKSNPYEIYTDGDWEWRVLKHYQSAEGERAHRAYARVYCWVHGFCDEYGDTYCRDIPGYNWNWDKEDEKKEVTHE